MDKPCPSDKIRNPKTGRCIKKDGPTVRRLQRVLKEKSSKTEKDEENTLKKPCPSDKIRNPKTGRCIKKDGPTARRLQRYHETRVGTPITRPLGIKSIHRGEISEKIPFFCRHKFGQYGYFLYLMNYYKNDCILISSNSGRTIWIWDNTLYPPIGNINQLRKEMNRCQESTKIRFVVAPLYIQISDNEAHMNMVLFDIKKKTAERFEPHGMQTDIKENKHISNKIDNDLQSLVTKLGYQYIPPHNICPYVHGPQILQEIFPYGESGLCVAYSFLYMHLRFEYPDWEPRETIEKTLASLDPQYLLSLIRNYVSFLNRVMRQFYGTFKKKYKIEMTFDEFVSLVCPIEMDDTKRYVSSNMMKIIQKYEEYLIGLFRQLKGEGTIKF